MEDKRLLIVTNTIHIIGVKVSCPLSRAQVMQEKINPDNDATDPSEEYFKRKNDSEDEENDKYYPQEESIPPHY